MKLKLTRKALADIERIYIESARRFGFGQADLYQQGLRESLQIVAEHPHLAREQTRFKRPVRIHPYESHLIVYVIHSQTVEVVRILHGHQNLRRIL